MVVGELHPLRQPLRPRRRRLPAAQADQHGRRHRPRRLGHGGDGERFGIFVTCQLLLRASLLLQYRRAYRHIEHARPIARLYLVGTGIGAALWTVSLLVPRPVGFALWGAAVLVEAVVPLVATRHSADVPLHVEHLPERFALFVILVLGESVAGIAHGLHDAEWAASAVPVAGLAFVLAAALWWSYFDLAGARAKRLLDEAGGEHSDRRHDVYVFGQLPLTLALATVGAAIELAVVQSGEGEVPAGPACCWPAGSAVYLVSMAITDGGMSRGAPRLVVAARRRRARRAGRRPRTARRRGGGCAGGAAGRRPRGGGGRAGARTHGRRAGLSRKPVDRRPMLDACD